MTNNEDHEHYLFGKYRKIMSFRVILYQIYTDLVMTRTMTIRVIFIIIILILITIINITNGNNLIFGAGETPKNRCS